MSELPSDDNITAVALRRMAVLSDESREVRARADALADVFDARDAENADEVASEWIDEPEARAWARRVLDEVVPMIDGSSVFVSLVPREEVDIKFAVETGLALMMDKPIIVVIQPGMPLPSKLQAVADAIVEFDASDPAAMQERIQQAFREVMDART